MSAYIATNQFTACLTSAVLSHSLPIFCQRLRDLFPLHSSALFPIFRRPHMGPGRRFSLSACHFSPHQTEGWVEGGCGGGGNRFPPISQALSLRRYAFALDWFRSRLRGAPVASRSHGLLGNLRYSKGWGPWGLPFAVSAHFPLVFLTPSWDYLIFRTRESRRITWRMSIRTHTDSVLISPAHCGRPPDRRYAVLRNRCVRSG